MGLNSGQQNGPLDHLIFEKKIKDQNCCYTEQRKHQKPMKNVKMNGR